MAYLGENSEVLNNVSPKTATEIISEVLDHRAHDQGTDSEVESSDEDEHFLRVLEKASRQLPRERRLATQLIGGGLRPRPELECEKCGKPLNGEHVCTRCGLVSKIPVLDCRPPRVDRFDGEPETRADLVFGWTITRDDHGLGSIFETIESGEEEKDWLIKRMKDLNEKPVDELLRDAMILVKRIVNRLDLPRPIHERIAYLYREVRERGLTRKIGTIDARAVIGALALIATREASVPRTEEEVLEKIEGLPTTREKDYHYDTKEKREVNQRTLRRARKTLEKELDLEVPRARPEQYIDRFATKLGLDREGAARARKIATMIDANKTNKPPQLVTAGIIYLANKGEVTQREVADAFSTHQPRISEASIEVSDLLVDAIADSGNSSGTIGG